MIRVAHSFSDVDHYRDDWNRLAGQLGFPTLSYEWFATSAEYFHKRDQLYIVLLLDEKNCLRAVAPLYRSERGSDRHLLQLIGMRHLYEPGGLLFDQSDRLCQLISAIRDLGFPFLIGRCIPDATPDRCLSRISFAGLLYRMAPTQSQFLQLQHNFEDYEQQLSSRRRYDLRRAQRRAADKGQVDYQVFRSNTNQIDELLERAMQVEAKSWKADIGSTMQENPLMSGFIKSFMADAAATNTALVAFLTIDGKAIASLIGVLDQQRLWILKIGYDQDCRDCSPGILLLHHLIEYSYGENLSGFEFLGNKERWIEMWKPEVRNYTSFLFYPLSYNGIRGFMIDAMEMLKRKLKGKIG